MKKRSTIAAKPSKKILQQRVTIGLDLGDRNSWCCVLDESPDTTGAARPHACDSVARGFQRDGAQPDRAGDRDAFALISRLLSELGHGRPFH
jgi:hypothetical protein